MKLKNNYFLFLFFIFFTNCFSPIFSSDHKRQQSNLFVLTEFFKKHKKGLLSSAGVGLSVFLVYWAFFKKNDKGEQSEKENGKKVNNETKNNQKKSPDLSKKIKNIPFDFSNAVVDGGLDYVRENNIFSDPSGRLSVVKGKEETIEGNIVLIPYKVWIEIGGKTEVEFYYVLKKDFVKRSYLVYIFSQNYSWSGGIKEQLLLDMLERGLFPRLQDVGIKNITITNLTATPETRHWWEKNGFVNNQKKLTQGYEDNKYFEFSFKNPLKIKRLPAWYKVKTLKDNEHKKYYYLGSFDDDGKNHTPICFTQEELNYFPILKECNITRDSEVFPFLVCSPRNPNSICTGVIDEKNSRVIITACTSECFSYALSKIKLDFLRNRFPKLSRVKIIVDSEEVFGNPEHLDYGERTYYKEDNLFYFFADIPKKQEVKQDDLNGSQKNDPVDKFVLIGEKNNNQEKTNVKEGLPKLPNFNFISDEESSKVKFSLSPEYSISITTLAQAKLHAANFYLEVPEQDVQNVSFIPFHFYLKHHSSKISLVKILCALNKNTNTVYIYNIHEDESKKETVFVKIFCYIVLCMYISTVYPGVVELKHIRGGGSSTYYVHNYARVGNSYVFLLKNLLKLTYQPNFGPKEQNDKNDNIFFINSCEDGKGENFCYFTEQELGCLPILKDCNITPESKVIPFLISKSNSICTGVIDLKNYVTIITACDNVQSKYFVGVIKKQMLEHYPEIVAIVAADKKLLGDGNYECPCFDYNNVPAKYIQSIDNVVKASGKWFYRYSQEESNLNILTLRERKKLIKKYINFANFIEWIFRYTTKPYPDMLPELLKTKIQGKELIKYVENCSNDTLRELIRKKYKKIILPVENFRYASRESSELLKNALYKISLDLSQYGSNTPLWFQLTDKELCQICIYQAKNLGKYNNMLCSITDYYIFLSKETTKKLKNILFRLTHQNPVKFFKLMKESNLDGIDEQNFSYLLKQTEEKNWKNFLRNFNNKNHEDYDVDKIQNTKRILDMYNLDEAPSHHFDFEKVSI